jgi:histidine triad (HIT) family protein
MPESCVFCRIVEGDADARKVYETDTILAFHDRNPQAPTHILIIPKKHIARLVDVEAGDADLMGEMLVAARLIAEEQGVADGFRLVINNGVQAGQSVFHIHLHLLAGRPFHWPPG